MMLDLGNLAVVQSAYITAKQQAQETGILIARMQYNAMPESLSALFVNLN